MQQPKDHEKKDMDRRSLLQQGWQWLAVISTALIVYPALEFLGFRAPKKPRFVTVHKDILPGGFAAERDFILFVSETGAWAVSRKCTHLGCRLNLKENDNVLLCPCHQSRFSLEGKRLAGPAKKDLRQYAVKRLHPKEGKGFVVTL